MAERLAETVIDYFTEEYIPKKTLELLFLSREYQPDQDHDKDFLLALGRSYSDFNRRSLYFINAIADNKENYDPPLKSVLDRYLQSENFKDLNNMMKSYEEWSKEGVCKADEWKRNLFSCYTTINPTSLMALWAIKHECQLKDQEKKFLINIIENWPLSKSSSNDTTEMNETRNLIYGKFKTIYHQRFSHTSGERKNRRNIAYEKGVLGKESGTIFYVYDALHDIDHAFLAWNNFLEVK